MIARERYDDVATIDREDLGSTEPGLAGSPPYPSPRRPMEPPTGGSNDELLERIGSALERITEELNEFLGIYLNTRFPFGKAIDRWPRR